MKQKPGSLSFLSIALLGLSGMGYAANASTAVSNITIPNAAAPGFGFSLTGLYLQPGASNLGYAIYTKPLPLTTPNWVLKSVDPKYNPAFDLGIQYLFADQTDQLSLDWLHLDTSSSASASANSTDSIMPPYYFGPLAQLKGTYASSEVTFHVDNVNLELDHAFRLGRYIQLDPFAGVSTAFLEQKITSTYLGVDSDSHTVPYSITSFNTSRFSSIGPRLGLNANALFGQHFSILAEMGASVLVGSMYSNTNFNSYGANNTTLVNTSLADGSQTQVVPELDSKVGLSYTTLFHSGSQLTVQAGYLFSTYLNGINQVVPTSLVPNAFNNGVIAIETAATQQSNLDLNGPYLQLAWLF